MYLNIQSSKNLKLDLLNSKKLIDLSILFDNENLIITIVNDCIMPNVDKGSCIRILGDYIKELYKEERTRLLFVDLVQSCIDIASKNIFYLINNQQDELSMIGEDSLEEIIET